MMRMTILLAASILLLSSLRCQIPGNDRKTDSNQTATSASTQLAELNARHSNRVKAIDKDDQAALTKANDIHVAEMTKFLRAHGKSSEGNRIRLKLGFMASRNPAYLDAARIALDSFVPLAGQEGAGLIAARSAARLKLPGTKAKILRKMSDSAKTITAKVDLVIQLKLGMKDLEWANQLMAETEALAKNDEQKSELLMGKASLARLEKPKDEARYQEALQKIVDSYPNTTYGKLASDKMTSAKLSIGSNPIPLAIDDIAGKQVHLHEYKGKVVLIDFWATWCIPCMKEVPSILAAYDEYEDQGFEVLGISLDRETQRAKFEAKIVEHGMRWRHVCDGMHWQAKVAQQYDVTSIPFTILIGRDGKIAARNLHGEPLRAAIQAALRKK